MTDEDTASPPAHLQIDARALAPGISAVSVAGSVDQYNYPRLRERITQEITAGSTYVVLELEKLEFLDATGLGLFVGIYKRLRQAGGSLYLVGLAERIQKILVITGLVRVLSMAPDACAAREAIGTRGGEPERETP